MPKPITTQPPTTGPFTAGPINQTLWLSGSVLSRRTLTGHMTDKVSFSQLPIMVLLAPGQNLYSCTSV